MNQESHSDRTMLALIVVGSIVIAAVALGSSASSSNTDKDAWKAELPKMPTGLVSETLPILTKVQAPNPTAADIAAAKAQADKVEGAGFPAIAEVLRQYASLRESQSE